MPNYKVRKGKEDTSSLRSDDVRESENSELFDRFWQAYPNKIGIAKARTAFSKALGSVTFDVLMDGLTRYVSKTDDRQWCNPTTWLNQARWADVPAIVARDSRQPPQAKEHRNHSFIQGFAEILGDATGGELSSTQPTFQPAAGAAGSHAGLQDRADRIAIEFDEDASGGW